MTAPLPILYSFRRCPYAIRARLAIVYSRTPVELREILLKDKPLELLEISPKATVPVLQLNNKTVLDESLDIMYWALTKNAADDLHSPLLPNDNQLDLITENDTVFKVHLDHYKYADRFPAYYKIVYRQRGEVFLSQLEQTLTRRKFLGGHQLGLVDYAICPFIRQFSLVDKVWFEQSHYGKLQQWLSDILASDIFSRVMQKYPQWKTGEQGVTFPMS